MYFFFFLGGGFYTNKKITIFIVQGQTRLNLLIAAIGPMGFFRVLVLSQGPDGIMLWVFLVLQTRNILILFCK